MRCRSASGIFQCNAVFNCRIWRFVHLTIRPLRSRWPDGITKFRSPAAPNYRKLPDSISSGSGMSACVLLVPPLLMVAGVMHLGSSLKDQQMDGERADKRPERAPMSLALPSTEQRL